MSSELKPCDFLGNEIRMGDEVAFFALGYRMFTRGIVARITPKCLFIDYDNSWNYDHHEEHTRQEQKQVIDLTALNRRAQPANEPLTLYELRGMDGEPVWCDWVNQWGLVNIDSESGLEFTYCDGSQNTYGEIVSCGIDPMAYRRKPERSENHHA